MKNILFGFHMKKSSVVFFFFHFGGAFMDYCFVYSYIEVYVHKIAIFQIANFFLKSIGHHIPC